MRECHYCQDRIEALRAEVDAWRHQVSAALAQTAEALRTLTECVPTKSLNVLNGVGELAASIRADENGAGHLILFGLNREPFYIAKLADSGPVIGLMSAGGRPRAALTADEVGGRLDLLDCAGNLTTLGTPAPS